MNKNSEKQFWIEFLELYKNLPVLWRVKSPDYSNRTLKSEAYDKMVDKLKEIDPSADRESVTRKINSFRSSYRRDLKKKIRSEKSGARARDIFQSSLWYFDILKFLENQEDTLEGIKKEKVLPNSSKAVKATKRKRSLKEEDKLMKLACDRLQESNNDATDLAKGWASQYAELSSRQKIFVRKLFSDVLFAGCLEKLNENVVSGVQNLLESSDTFSTSWCDPSIP